MARPTAEIETELAAWRAARLKQAQGGALQSWSIGGKSFSMLSLSEINATIADLEAELAEARGNNSPIVLANLRGGRLL